MKKWFQENQHLFSAIPGLLFFSAIVTLFGPTFPKVFILLMVIETSSDFLYENLWRWNYFMDDGCPKRPFLWLFCKIFRSRPVNNFLDAFEEWKGYQPYLARSVICALDGFVFFFIIVICLAGSGLDYVWYLAFKK